MNTIFSIRTAPNKINLKDLSILFNKDKDIEIIYTSLKNKNKKRF